MTHKRTAIFSTLALLVGALTAPIAGQWPGYRTPGIPRLPDGKPNLAAPAPRTADGKPDLSGLWQADSEGAGAGVAAIVTQDLPPGVVQPWALSVYQERLLNLALDSPNARCLPPGLPAMNSFQMYFARIVQTPAVIVITYQGETTDHFRTVFTDGRTLPEDPNPTWSGYSVGHWEGDTLVVNTSGFNDKGWLDFNGHPQTESLRVTERFRRRDLGHLLLEMTLDDPKVFTRPVTVRIDKVLAVDYEPVESVCDNEKDARHLIGGNGFRLNAGSLAQYAGTYEFAPGRRAVISLADGFLHFQAGASAAKRVLVPQTEVRFMFRDNGDGVEFVRNSQDAITRFVIHGAGGDQTATRVSAVRDDRR
jgi:hypothetical protein